MYITTADIINDPRAQKQIEALRKIAVEPISALTALRKDKARLDYILSCGFLLKQGSEDWSYIPVRHDEDGRKIIDAAMEGK